MRSIVLIMLITCASVFICSADVTSAVDVTLHDGINEVVLNLSNNWNRDIHNISATVDELALPHWLTVDGDNDSIMRLGSGDDSAELTLSLRVTDVTDSEHSNIGVILKDDVGNCWTVPLTVTYLATDNSPVEYTTELSANYPNPFNPTTSIPYSNHIDLPVRIVIYNSVGQKISTLVDAHQPAGHHVIQWDGRDDQGNAVSSGMYFCRFTAGAYTQTRRMLLIE